MTRIDKFQEITERIIKILDQGVKPWEKSWYSVKYQNLVSGHEYSGWNPIICAIDCTLYGYEYPFFVGVGQARERGWRIKKGAKSTWIKFFSKFTKEEEEEEEQEIEEEEEKEKEGKTRSFFTSKWLQVFNVSCLDDSKSKQKIEPLIREKLPRSLASEKDRIERVEQFIKSHNPTIVYGGDTPCYSAQADKIRMPRLEDFSTVESFYSTLLHELTHWTGHESRCNRSLGNKFGSKAYAYEELIAELGSAFLCSSLEIKTKLEHHASYLKGWISAMREDSKYLFRAMADADKAVKYLLKDR